MRWDAKPSSLTRSELLAELDALGDPRARRVRAAVALSEAVEQHALAMSQWDARLGALRQASEEALWNGQRELERVRLIGIELAKADRPADASSAAAAIAPEAAG